MFSDNFNTDDATLQASTEKVALLILGMHRSGTSALARVLALAGAALPQNLLGAGEGNETGHWEPKRIALLNEEWMRSLNHTWLDWTQLNLERMSVEDKRTFSRDIKTIITEEYGDAPLIVCKEPRICRLANTYIEAIRDLNYRPVSIIIFRNPLEVVDSLMARSSWPDHRTDLDAAILWLAHVLDAELASRGTERVFWNYANLFGNWPDLMQLIRHHGKVDIPVSSEAMTRQVNAFLDPARRHQRRDIASPHTGSPSLGWLREALDALEILAADPWSSHAMSALDRIRSALQYSMPVLEQSLEHRSQQSALLTDSQAEAAAALVELSNTKQRLNEERLLFDNSKADTAAVRAELSELRLEAQKQSAAHTALQQELAAYQTAIHGLLSSRSWRITAPIRYVRPAIGKAARTLKGLGHVAGQPKDSVNATKQRVAEVNTAPAAAATSIARKPAGVLPPNYTHSFDERDDFINSTLKRRKDTLLSLWHRRLIDAVGNTALLPPEGPSLSLSLVTYNSAQWLPQFFASLRAQNFPLTRLNIIFVDNSSTDDTVALVEAERAAHGHEFSSFQLHHQPNTGFGAGHHYAISCSSDEFVLVSNVDVELHQDTISGLWRACLADADDIASWEVRQCPYEHPKYYDPVTLETSWSSHACVLLRKRAYDEVGGYEKRLFMYGEDVELSYRFRSNGWRLRYLPQITVTHFVDLESTQLRPHQLPNSIAANVLLRHRYGGPEKAAEGEMQLEHLRTRETDADRLTAFTAASTIVDKHRVHFSSTGNLATSTPFPFRGFDYDVCRLGHDVMYKPPSLGGEEPLVSIITRTHGPKLGPLSEAIASVSNQSYRNIQHIIVEDRTDFAAPLAAAARELYGRNIDYLKSSGKGRSRAGNCGLENARGEYLMFLDNDDLLFSDHVELLARELSRNPDAGAAYALAWEVQTAYTDSGAYKELSHVIHPTHRLEFSLERLLQANHIPIQCIMFRRTLYDRLGGFDEALELLEDWNLWARYAQHATFTFIPKLTSLYRVPGDEDVRRERQVAMDSAYLSVKERNLEAASMLPQRS